MPSLRRLLLSVIVLAIDALVPSLACSRLKSLQALEGKVYSQNGEDGVLVGLLDATGTRSKYYVEFGVSDGSECNTRLLRERLGFTGLSMDGGFEQADINLRREFVTEGNILELLSKYEVPLDLDVLSVDVDMFDWWILLRILRDSQYRPLVIVVETNPTLCMNHNRWSPRTEFNAVNAQALTVTHPSLTNQTVWDLSRYSGANPLAFALLGARFGYDMVYCESCGVNCFLVLRSALPEECQSHFQGNLPTIPTPCFAGINNHPLPGHEVDASHRPALWLDEHLLSSVFEPGFRPTILEDARNAPYVHCSPEPLSRGVVGWCDYLPSELQLPRKLLHSDLGTAMVAVHEAALEHFRAGSFLQAAQAFSRLLALMDSPESEPEPELSERRQESSSPWQAWQTWLSDPSSPNAPPPLPLHPNNNNNNDDNENENELNTFPSLAACVSRTSSELACSLRASALLRLAVSLLRAELVPAAPRPALSLRTLDALRLAHQLSPSDPQVASLLALLSQLVPTSAPPLAAALASGSVAAHLSLEIASPADNTTHHITLQASGCTDVHSETVSKACSPFALGAHDCAQVESQLAGRVAAALFPGVAEALARSALVYARGGAVADEAQAPSLLLLPSCVRELLSLPAIRTACPHTQTRGGEL